ncbi:MAG: heparinase II/III family protein [Pseudomonadota bacterium]
MDKAQPLQQADAGRWLKKGLTLIGEEMDEQILPDGGHFERSPMHHAMILEDCLDLLNLLAGFDAALGIEATPAALTDNRILKDRGRKRA